MPKTREKQEQDGTLSAPGARSVAADGRRRITLPYPPSANRYWRTTARIIHGRAQVLTYPSPEAKRFKAQVFELLRAAGWRPERGEVELHLDVYRPLQSGDLSNRIKVLEDSLQGGGVRGR